MLRILLRINEADIGQKIRNIEAEMKKQYSYKKKRALQNLVV